MPAKNSAIGTTVQTTARNGAHAECRQAPPVGPEPAEHDRDRREREEGAGGDAAGETAAAQARRLTGSEIRTKPRRRSRW
jgi:hypothetical protein